MHYGKKNTLQAVHCVTQRSADFRSHLLSKLLNSAHHHNKLHQFLLNIYKKLQLCGSKKKKTPLHSVRKDAERSAILPSYCFLFIVNT